MFRQGARPPAFSGCDPVVFDFFRLAEGSEAFEQRQDGGFASAQEAAGDLVGGGLAHFGQRFADGVDLVGEVPMMPIRPWSQISRSLPSMPSPARSFSST